VPNEYILALCGDLSAWSYDEERAPLYRGQWRERAFGREGGVGDGSGAASGDCPLDLEIGTGNGLHFAHRALTYPDRCLIGMELKYKPLIQSIRRCLRGGSGANARVVRYNALLLQELFTPGELNDVFIFFPDPWEKLRQHKHRLIQDEFLIRLFEIQRAGSRVYFKTDSADYFAWALERFRRSPYRVVGHTDHLHGSEFAASNFITQFESIFIRQGLKIGYAELVRE